MGHFGEFPQKATAKLELFFELTKFNPPKSAKSCFFDPYMALE